MMANFMGKHVRLREFTGRPESLLQFIVEPEVDIYLLVFRAIKRTCRGLRCAAPGTRVIPKENQFGVPILFSCLPRKDLFPGFLRIVQYERNKLHEGALGFRLRGVGSGRDWCRPATAD